VPPFLIEETRVWRRGDIMNFKEIIRQQTVGREFIAASADLSALGGCSDTWIHLLKLIMARVRLRPHREGQMCRGESLDRG